MPDRTPIRDRVLFGAAFYDEYRVTGSLDRDLDLMSEAGFSIIRVGESVWSSWEPRPGEFHTEWLLPVLDGAHRRRIDVILGTPTYAVPPWLAQLHPEIAAEDATGRRVPWGYRQEIDVTNIDFRHYAERVIRSMISRYADHPSVIGFQVDNEPGLHLLHNPEVFAGFLRRLELAYGTVDNLNQEWGLTHWSHRLTDWSQLWRPDGNSSPQYQLEWRRFQNDVIAEFLGWQAGIVREYATGDQFVTTCISYERPAVDDVAIMRSLDIASGNPYYKMQDALRIGVEVPRPEMWWSSGVWALFEQADRMWASTQDSFLVTETNAQSIGQSHWQNHPPYPGQIAQAALALVSRGARMVEYWQWQTLHSGLETYWGGVLPHSGEPGRLYSEIADLGRRIKDLEPALVGYRPDVDVTMLYSNDTKQSFQFYPPLATDSGGPDSHAYLRIFDSFYRGAFEAGLQVGIMHSSQFVEQDAAEFAASSPVLFVPSLYIASDSELDALVAYANAGGHVVVGIRTGYGDDLARARAERAPGRLADAAGISYEEYSNLDLPVAVDSELFGGGRFEAAATGWADALNLDGAEVVATYAGGPYQGRPVVTTHATGAGRLTYVGTVPSREFARAIAEWAVPSPEAGHWNRDEVITIASGRSNAGRVSFLTNWSDAPAVARCTVGLTVTGETFAPGAEFVLAPGEVKVLIERGVDRGATNSAERLEHA
jgi:beta-galactosidase